MKNKQLTTLPPTFTQKIGKTTYTVNIHFSETSKETLNDKVERLILREIENIKWNFNLRPWQIDTKGSIVIETGKLLQQEGYVIKILNTINFNKSMKYNPLAYIRSEKDILKLVTTLISNTKGDSKGGDDFWVKAETLLYTALIGYIWYEAPEEEQNFNTLVEFINASEVREDDEDRSEERRVGKECRL